jgi:hypothetical protein
MRLLNSLFFSGDVVSGVPELTPAAIQAGIYLARRLFGGKSKVSIHPPYSATFFLYTPSTLPSADSCSVCDDKTYFIVLSGIRRPMLVMLILALYLRHVGVPDEYK